VTNIRTAINAAELVLATVEGLIRALDAARQVLSDSTAQLNQSIIDAQKNLHDDLAADRKKADDALDRKFAASKDGGST